MDGYPNLSGETRVIAIIGDPIAQVKSPAGVTRALNARGRSAVCVPIHVAAADVEGFIRGVGLAKNFDGIIVTVPHKFAVYAQCATASARAHLLGAVNTLRRNADGSWHGDQLDGEGFVAGLRAAGCRPAGRRALLTGAGGAGSAIGLALLEAGVTSLAIHDGDPARCDALVGRLADRYPGQVQAGSADPSGCTLVVNATPAGMRAGDPYPVPPERLDKTMFVADVITRPAVTPLIAAARRIGCATQVGAGMFEGVLALMVDYLVAGAAPQS